MRIDWADVRDFLNPLVWWAAYFGKTSYIIYICGQLVRLDAAPGRGYLTTTDEYAKVSCNIDAQWQQVADQDNYPGHVEAFVAEYAREIDAQHKDPRTAWNLLVSRLPPAARLEEGMWERTVEWHRAHAQEPLSMSSNMCNTCGGLTDQNVADKMSALNLPGVYGCRCVGA